MAIRSNNEKIVITRYETDIKDEGFLYTMFAARLANKYADIVFDREAAISRVKYIALTVIDHYGSMTPSELAAAICTERHNITTLIRRMEKEGLVTRKRDTQDERRIYISITDHGREVLSQALTVARDINKKIMLSINEDEAAILKRLSKIILQNANAGLSKIT